MAKTTGKSQTPKPAAKKTVFRSDTKQLQSLTRASRAGSAKAIRTSKALGLTITYLKNDTLIKEDAEGNVVQQVVKRKPVQKKTSVALKKGMVFHAKK